MACGGGSSTEEKVEDGNASIKRINQIYPEINQEMSSYNNKSAADVALADLNATKAKIEELLSLTSHVESVASEDGVIFFDSYKLANIKSNGNRWLDDVNRFIDQKKKYDADLVKLTSVKDKLVSTNSEMQELNVKLSEHLKVTTPSAIRISAITALSNEGFNGFSIEDLKELAVETKEIESNLDATISYAQQIKQLIKNQIKLINDSRDLLGQNKSQAMLTDFQELDSSLSDIIEASDKQKIDASKLNKQIEAEIRESSGENGPVPEGRLRPIKVVEKN